MHARSALASALLLVLAAPNSAWGAWPPTGRPVVTAPGNQRTPAIVTDGAGGAIVAWGDSVNLFAGRVLASGELDPAWPANGRALRSDLLGVPGFLVMASDGSGGAIVAWEDARNAATSTDLFAQHVLASGALDPAWPANGLLLCGAQGVQESPKIVADAVGGAIVTWQDRRGGGNALDIYAQHARANGTVDPAWPVNGLAVSTAPSAQLLPEITSDGQGGALVTWTDLRSNVTGVDVYVQHVRANGSVDPAWPVDGRAVTLAQFDQFFSVIASDGAGGALVAWQDGRSGFTHTFGNHVLATGLLDPRWPANGLEISNTSQDETQPRIVLDGAGGALVTFLDVRNLHHNVYAVHVLGEGALDPAWPDGGRALSVTETEQTDAAMTGDGAGGAFVAWQDGDGVAAQHVRADGSLDPALPANGRALGDASDTRSEPAIVLGGGGAIVAWTDRRPGQASDVFALQVLESGAVAVPDDPAARAFSFAAPSPNPARAGTRFRFWLPRAGAVRLGLYDARGRLVRVLAEGVRTAGEQSIDWDQSDPHGARVRGVLFARLETAGGVFARTIVAL